MRLPNGSGSVHKIGGTKKRRNPWRARVTDGWDISPKTGEARQKYKTIGYFPDRKTALQALMQYNSAPIETRPADATFAEVFSAWSAEHYEKLSISSREGYNSAFKNSAALHDMKIADIKAEHLKKVMDATSPGVKNRLKTFWGLVFKYALERDLIEKNYSEFVNVRLTEDEKSIKKKAPFSADELAALWAALGEVFGVDAILILCYTGMRPSELLGIRSDDVNLHERYMVGGIKTAAGKNRMIPIHRKILPLIESLLSDGRKTLIDWNGKPMSYDVFRARLWLPAMEQLQMDHTPHECRHTGISMMRAANIDRDLIKLIVGHSSADVTDRYIHTDPATLVDAIDRIP